VATVAVTSGAESEIAPRRGAGEKAAAMSSGAVTLGELAGRLPMLEVACSRCERRGRLNVAGLIERHGADARLPDLLETLAADSPCVGARSMRSS
jgi:hypothetical protein